MRFKIFIFFIISVVLFNCFSATHALPKLVDEEDFETTDTTRRTTTDSIREAHNRTADSIRNVRKNHTDSLTKAKKYKDSKHYKDSVSKVKIAKADLIKQNRNKALDSVKNIRNSTNSQLADTRKSRADSIKTVQKNKADSLLRVKKYKASKRFADSVAIVKRNHTDSIKVVQTKNRDSISNYRKHIMDSTKTVRKHIQDSTKLVRTKYMDSVKLVRKIKTDSLAKVKAEKERLAKSKEKKKQEELKLKLEIKFKTKREQWTNKSMLKKKWSPQRRLVQNAFTHYNYYYNANKKMEDALVNMQRTKKENLDSLIGLYPFDPNRDSSLLSSDMDSIVRKASIGLQIHDPRVKWANDMFLLMGEAYYYKGRYENAATSFRYIISSDEEQKKKDAPKYSSSNGNKSKEQPSILEEEQNSKLDFLKHKSVHNEAILWLARTYTESKKIENAEMVISLLEGDPNLPDDLIGRLAVEKAFAYLANQNYEEASKQLDIVIEDGYLPDYLKMRAAFLNGQLAQNRGDFVTAITNYEKNLSYFPKIEMDFYARKNIAYNSLMAGNEVDEAMRPLKKVLNDAKYVNYYDQVYYVLGKIAIKAGKTDDAIKYLNKSISTPKASKKQKALSFAALGDAYYSASKYPVAKNAYDSAAKYATGSSKDTTGLASIQRGKVLNEIVGPTNIIHDQDSLMALAQLSKREQTAAVRKYLHYLQQIIQDSIDNAMLAGNTITVAEPANDNTEASNWYFSSPTQIQQGSAEFKRKWGNRPLTDNWRHATNQNIVSSKPDDNEETVGNTPAEDNGLPSEEYLLSRIPNKQEQKDLSNKTVQKAYIQLAKAYFKQLEDYVQASATLDILDKKFPNHNQKEEELYLRYQIALAQNQLAKAQTYSDQLLDKFPKSVYADILRPKHNNKSEAQNSTVKVAEFYEETYNMVLKHQYTEAMVRIELAKKQYDNLSFSKRFKVLEAMAYAGAGNYDKADSTLLEFNKQYGGDTLSTWSNSVKEYIAAVRKSGFPAWYKETPPGEKDNKIDGKTDKMIAKNDSVKKVPKSDIPSFYAYKPAEEHICIVVLPGLDGRTGILKQNLTTFNKTKYPDAAMEINIDFYGMQQTIVVLKKFPNADTAKKYMNDLKIADVLHDYKPEEYQALIISSNNYKKLFADKKLLHYLSFYNTAYK